MTPFVWMFIKSYEKLRKYIIENREISSLIQMEYSAFEEATVPICTFTIGNSGKLEKGTYIRLAEFVGGMEVQKEKVLEALNNISETNYLYYTNQQDYKKIPNLPISYWVSKNAIEDYSKGKTIGEISKPRTGMTTGDNNQFLRYWFEINISKAKFDSKNSQDAKNSNKKWFPYGKGGGFRKWYGYNEYLVNWEDNGYSIKNNIKENGKKAASVRSEELYFSKLITWSAVTSGDFSCRLLDGGALFDSGGSSIFAGDETTFILALLNGKVGQYFLDLVNPTINYQPGDIASVPIINNEHLIEISKLVEENIYISKKDWNSSEVSWDFSKHPFYQNNSNSLKIAYETWDKTTKKFFEIVKLNEEKLNEIFIKIYNLKNVLNPEVSPKSVSIRLSERLKDIKSFVSYAVGCMFGRYSLDEEGLIYAGGEWDSSRYQTFTPNTDNVLLISDEEYFEDSSLDIVNRFVDFVRISFGVENLDDNLQFIADTLGGKGNSKEIIRNYFVKNFFKDHVQTYSKRPIYWQFDSGTANGFKALIYMHRYDQDTLGKVRTDYLHQIQKAYESRIELRREQVETSDNDREKLKWRKEIEKLTKQLKETKEYDEKLGHLSLQRTTIDLDDGVMVNYDKIQRDENGKLFPILAKGPATPKK